jgi:hypothetical protein
MYNKLYVESPPPRGGVLPPRNTPRGDSSTEGRLVYGAGDSSTEGETRLRRGDSYTEGRLVYRGGDSSTEGESHSQNISFDGGTKLLKFVC